MKVKITKPCTVTILNGEVEVSDQEFTRLGILGLIDKTEEKAVPEVKEKTTRKGKK